MGHNGGNKRWLIGNSLLTIALPLKPSPAVHRLQSHFLCSLYSASTPKPPVHQPNAKGLHWQQFQSGIALPHLMRQRLRSAREQDQEYDWSPGWGEQQARFKATRKKQLYATVKMQEPPPTSAEARGARLFAKMGCPPKVIAPQAENGPYAQPRCRATDRHEYPTRRRWRHGE